MNAWDDERTLVELSFDVPEWIEQDITPSTLAAIEQGGCASGAYMPAVTYHTARKVMGEHGDDVATLLGDWRMPEPLVWDPFEQSWSGHCCDVLSAAVEVWARDTLDAYREQYGEDE